MRRRDEPEFDRFAADVIHRLRRTAYLMCGDWHRAEDAAQDALVRVYTAWPRLTHRGGLSSYAHRAVVSVVMDQSRRPWRRERTGVETAIDHQVSPDQVGTVNDRRLVIDALRTLPPRQRACIVLRHYVDMSLEETAEALGISTGAVKSQTSRGLAVLREALGSSEPERTLQ